MEDRRRAGRRACSTRLAGSFPAAPPMLSRFCAAASSAAVAAVAAASVPTRVAGHWSDSGTIVNDNFAHFDVDSVSSRISIAAVCVLVPFYLTLAFMVHRRRHRFPFNGLYPTLLITNSFVVIATLFLRLALWVNWPDRGPPCGLEFVVLLTTLLPFIGIIILRAWFLLFKNEITSHLNHVSAVLEDQHRARQKREQERREASKEKEGDTNASTVGGVAKNETGQQNLNSSSPLQRLRQLPSSSPTSPGKMMTRAPSHKNSLKGAFQEKLALAVVSVVENSTSRDRIHSTAETPLHAPIVVVHQDSAAESPRKLCLGASELETTSVPVVQAGWTASTSDAPVAIHKVEVGNDLDAAKKETTTDAPLETALTVGEEDASDSGAADLTLLYSGFSGWFVRHRKLTSVKVVSLISANLLIGAGLVMVFLAFIDPDTLIGGGSLYETQIRDHLFDAPPCSFMSIKQWIVRGLMLVACPLVTLMYVRMHTRPADAYGLWHFMATSAYIGTGSLLSYIIFLAYAPTYCGVSIVVEQILLAIGSDVKPLIESYTTARARRKAFADASIAARDAAGDDVIAQQRKQLYRLKVVLRHPIAAATFLDFTRKEFSSENVTFWNEVRHFVRSAQAIEAQLHDWPRLGDDAPGADAPRTGTEGISTWATSEHDGTVNGGGGGGGGGRSLLSRSDADEGSTLRSAFLGQTNDRRDAEAALIELGSVAEKYQLPAGLSMVGGGADSTVPVSGAPSATASPALMQRAISNVSVRFPSPVLGPTSTGPLLPNMSPTNQSPTTHGGGDTFWPADSNGRDPSASAASGTDASIIGGGGASLIAPRPAPLARPLSDSYVAARGGGGGATAATTVLATPDASTFASPIASPKYHSLALPLIRGYSTVGGSGAVAPAPVVPVAAVPMTQTRIASLRAQAIEVRTTALSLHSQFLAPGAPFEVNVPSDIIADVTRQVKLIEEWTPVPRANSQSQTPRVDDATSPSDAAITTQLALPTPPPVPLSALYRAAHVCIFDLMQRDSFRRFVVSPEFADLLTSVEAEARAAEARRLEEAVAAVHTTDPAEQLLLLESLEKEAQQQLNQNQGASASATASARNTPLQTPQPSKSPAQLAANRRRTMSPAGPQPFALGESAHSLVSSEGLLAPSPPLVGQASAPPPNDFPTLHTVNESGERDSEASSATRIAAHARTPEMLPRSRTSLRLGVPIGGAGTTPSPRLLAPHSPSPPLLEDNLPGSPSRSVRSVGSSSVAGAVRSAS